MGRSDKKHANEVFDERFDKSLTEEKVSIGRKSKRAGKWVEKDKIDKDKDMDMSSSSPSPCTVRDSITARGFQDDIRLSTADKEFAAKDLAKAEAVKRLGKDRQDSE